MTENRTSFDQQAHAFDKRTGLTDPVARQVAETICELAESDQSARILEVGAGTGEIGVHLAARSDAYIGIDESQGMLDHFKQRMDPKAPVHLVCQDANRRWPVEAQWANIIFGSRVFHLLQSNHLLEEILRTARSEECTFLLGRVERDKESVKSQMRTKMRQLLEERGQAPRRSNRRLKKLVTALNKYGARVEPTVAATWEMTSNPADSIRGWADKNTMGGIVPAEKDKQLVLKELREWAAEHFGGLDITIASRERYVLEGVRLTSR